MTVSPSPERNPLGWIALGVMLAYVIFSQLSASLDQDPSDRFGSIAQRARVTVSMQAVLTEVSGERETTDPAVANYRESLIGYADAIAKLDPDPEQAALEVALRLEAESKPRAEAIKLLRDSRDQAFQALATAAETETLTAEEAQTLADAMAGHAYALRLGRAATLGKAGLKGPRPGYSSESKTGMVLFVGVALIGSAAGWIGLLVWRAMRGMRPGQHLGLPCGPITRTDADGLAIRAAIMFAVFLFGGLAAMGLAQAFGPYQRDATVVLTAVVLIAGVFFALRLKIAGRSWTLADLGLRSERPLADVAWGVGAAFANLPLLLVVSSISQFLFQWLPEPTHPISSELAGGGAPWRIALLFAQAALLAPFFEEVLFRGAIFPALSRVLRSVPLGIALSGLLFAAIHPQGVGGWLPLMLLGSVMAWLCAVRRSLVPAIVMHATHNAGILILNLLLTG